MDPKVKRCTEVYHAHMTVIYDGSRTQSINTEDNLVRVMLVSRSEKLDSFMVSAIYLLSTGKLGGILFHRVSNFDGCKELPSKLSIRWSTRYTVTVSTSTRTVY